MRNTGFLAQRRAHALLIASAVGLAATPTAFAAEPDDSSLMIEEVLVTARRMEESVQDVPIAMTAITDQLTGPTIRDLVDLNGFAPNVIIGEDGSRGGGGANINIRGISPTRTDDNSFDSPIGFMVDDIYIASLAGQVMENFDIERVEVLRGPQGTLFGRNTVGGVVHVVRTRPTGELGARVRATVGRFGQQEFRGVFNTPVIEDKLAAKFFYTNLQDDGFINNRTTGNDFGAKDYQNYGVALLATPTDNFEALLTIEQFKDDSMLNAFHTSFNLAPGVASTPTDPNETDFSDGFTNCLLFPDSCRTSFSIPNSAQASTDNNSQLGVDAITLRMEYALNENASLVSITGYRDTTEERIYDLDGSNAPFITIERWDESDQFSQELRFDGQWDRFSITAGAYYWNSEYEQDWVTGDSFWSVLFGGVAADPAVWGACQAGALAPVFCDTGIPGGIPLGETVTQILYATQETESTALFAEAQWEFADNWRLTAGVRWTEETKEFLAGQAYLSNVARQRERNFPEFADLENTWNDVSPRIGLSYTFNDNMMAYGTYSEGFHSGGFFGVNQNTRDFERDQYDPEFAKSWELGFKSTLLEQRMLLNLAAFYNDFTDKQEQSIQIDPDTRTVATVFDNVADAVYWGFEVESQYVFNENFRAFINYGYLDAEYKDFETDINAADGMTMVEDASFLKPRNAPDNTIGVGGTFSKQIGPGSFEVYAKYTWVDEVETDLLNTPFGRQDGFEDLTASIGYFTENYTISLFGRNLTNVEIETTVPIATLFAAGNLRRPINYGLEFTYNFNR
ncbi:MAG: TonB-dependent receptor [Pseudomonadota bacterium]